MPQRPPAAGVDDEFWTRRPDDHPPRRVDASALRDMSPPPFAGVAHDGVWTRLGERVAGWRSDARIGVLVLCVVAIAAGVVWYRIGVGGGDGGDAAAAKPVPSATRPPTSGSTSTTVAVARSVAGAKILVHVAGAVVHAGVVELGANARVIDAIEAVGGAQPDGDLDRLNLAAKLADGDRVYVAKVGQADPGDAAGGAVGGSGSSASGPAGTAARVNLNTATQAQLESLPGIGPTYAQAIIAARRANGGFKSVNELRNVRGIGDKRFAELAPLVTV
jgi:competence protein ComEA